MRTGALVCRLRLLLDELWNRPLKLTSLGGVRVARVEHRLTAALRTFQ